MLLPKSFYNRSTLRVAQDLLGCFLCRRLEGEAIRCKITETEAYIGFKDKASHASRGKTARNAPMFGPSGYTYVYFTYGLHYMLNIVTEREGYPAAVLIRAIRPIPAVETRQCLVSTKCLVSTNGPAKLTKALHIDKSLNNVPVFTKKNNLWIERGVSVSPSSIARAPRVGIDYAGEYKNKLWRFYLKDKKIRVIHE